MARRSGVAFSIYCSVCTIAACGGTLEMGGESGHAGMDASSGNDAGNIPATGGTQNSHAGRTGTGTGGGGGSTSVDGGRGGTAGANFAGAGAGPMGGVGAFAGAGAGAGATPGAGAGAGGSPGVGGGPVAGSAGYVDSGGAGGEGAGTTPNCSCATSDALRVIDCGGGRHFGGHAETYLTADGSSLIYAPDDGTGQWGMYLGNWSLSQGTIITDGWPLGLSEDGNAMLYGIGSDYFYRDASGSTHLTAELRVLSRDGKVAAGARNAGSGQREAVTWSRAAGIAGTGVVSEDTIVVATSGDGSVIGGQIYEVHPSGDATQPFLWSEATGALLIGDAPSDGSVPEGVVAAISANGASAAGVLLASAGDYRVFHRSAAGQLTDLGNCFRSPYFSCVAVPAEMGLSFSDDGAILAGALGDANDPHVGNAFVYTQADGVTLLSPYDATTVRGISSDGSVVLGVFLDGPSADRPFVWDRTRGVRRLRDVLSAAGVSLDGWSLDDASELAKDGRVVVGLGTCGGEPAIYRAVLPQ